MTRTRFIPAIGFALILAACGDKPAAPAPTGDIAVDAQAQAQATPDRKISAALVAKLSDLADTLETVQDEESARNAAETIAAIRADMAALIDKVDSSHAGTKISLLTQANSSEFNEVQTRIAAQIGRIAITKPKLMKIIGEEIDKLDL